MGFYIDLEKVTTEMFYDYIKRSRVFETHLILKENIDKYVATFKELGYKNVKQLYSDIKTPSKVVVFSETNNIDKDYVIVLRRHILSLIAKPRSIEDFKMMKPSTKEYLRNFGIKTTKDLFDRFTEISCDDMEYITCVADLSRQRYMHATYLDALYYSGYTSMKELSDGDVESLTNKINQTLNTYHLSKQKFGLKDAKYIIDDAKLYLKLLAL